MLILSHLILPHLPNMISDFTLFNCMSSTYIALVIAGGNPSVRDVKTLPFMRDKIGFDFVSELRKIQHIADLKLTDPTSSVFLSFVDHPAHY